MFFQPVSFLRACYFGIFLGGGFLASRLMVFLYVFLFFFLVFSLLLMNVLLPFPLAYHPLYPLDLLAEYLFLERWMVLPRVRWM